MPPPGAWRGADLRVRTDWIHVLDAAESDALRAVARAHADAGRAPDAPGAAELPLAALAARLERIAHGLRHGPGVALVKGIDGEALDEVTLASMLALLGAHFGTIVSQNHRGERIGRVTDISDAVDTPRLYQRGGRFEMHRDPVDVVALMCVRKARRGGGSRVVSALAVHDVIAAEHPQCLQALYAGFHCWRPAPDRGAAPALTRAPIAVFSRDGRGRVDGCHYIPQLIRAAPDHGAPAIAGANARALSVLDAVAHRDDLVLDMDLEPGDVQLLNNRITLHGRHDYEDDADPARRRLMLRLWVMVPQWGGIAPHLRHFDDADALGGGIPRRDAAA